MKTIEYSYSSRHKRLRVYINGKLDTERHGDQAMQLFKDWLKGMLSEQ